MKIIIFAGGVGSRLWPLSRKNSPKQFGKVIGGKSTLQQTIDRLYPTFNPQDIYIATGIRYKDIVEEQLREIPQKNFIYEPEMRDVGPAIGLTAVLLSLESPDEPIAILWSDHMVKHAAAFRNALLVAGEKIERKEANFVFIAQKPRFANQNIGWIELGEKIQNADGTLMYRFNKLRYRPSLPQAEEFFHNEHFVWNLGYFVTTPKILLQLFKDFVPSMYEKLLHVQEAAKGDNFEEVLKGIYPTLEKISFDDAILQKLQTDHEYVIVEDLGWSDVGAWEGLKEALAKSEDENVTHGKILLEDSLDCLVFNYTDQLVVGIDLHAKVVINTEDVLLVCPKTSVPKIKKLVENFMGTEHEHLA